MKIPESAAQSFAKAVFQTKKNSPHIFFGLGVVGIIGSAVLACRATLKLEETLDELREEVEDANKTSTDIVHSAEVLTPEVIDHAERERAKELTLVSTKGVVTLGKLYGPAVLLGGISVACLAGSHVQLTRRNATLTAAFTALSKAFDDYRIRVRNEVGEEKELDIYRSIETIEIKDEKGKKQLVRAVNPDGLSIYSKCFDESSHKWVNNAEFNRNFLETQEKYWNHRLHRDGFVFLKDVYESLGFEPTSASILTGWLVNPETGDGYIDFGLYEGRNTRFMNNLEPSIWVDFNVDGPIWDKIP